MMASSLSPSEFTGDRWTIEIRKCCLPIRVIETNPPLVRWHWLGFRSSDTICQNLCIDSVHLNWINMEDNLVQHRLFNSFTHNFE